MKRVFAIVFSVLLFGAAQAQTVTGSVKDQQGKGVDKSTVSLLSAKDSSVVKLGVTTENGRFSVPVGKTGRFLVRISHVGYVPVYSAPFELSGSGDLSLPEMLFNKSTGDLKGVTVTSQKPIVEVKADKMVLNVEGTINSTGNDALELLRKSPGVLVDKDDNLSLAGKNGVAVYIDGKPSPLSGSDLSAYLKSLQSAQIESIEIITDPSAKYDAAGNAGIINIKLKKNKSFGTNGSVNAGYNIGTYARYNAGISLNHRNKNVNTFANYNYNNGLNDINFKLRREQLDTLFDQGSNMKMKNVSHGFKAGLDYFIDNKSTFGVMINGTLSDQNMSNLAKTPISYIPTGVVDRLLVANNSTDASRNNINYNANYRYADTAGRELNLDADYGVFRIKNDQLQPNYYYNAAGTTKLSEYIYRFISPTDIDIYSIKADYSQNVKKGKLGVGFKNSLVNTGNHFGRYNVIGGVKQLDVNRSNQFDYRENINAVYLTYNRPLKKGASLQVGARVENTNVHGDSYPLNFDGSVDKSSRQRFKKNYTDLFPSASLNFSKNPMKQWSLAYSRRIDRPAYQDLNPFEFKLDEYTYQKGNINLRPQYTNSFSLTNVYKYKLTTKLNYSHVTDMFTQLVDTAEKSKTFISKQNLATQNITSLNISYPFMYKTYMAFVNFNTYYSRYKADFGGGSRVINLDVFAYTVYMQHTLKMGKKKPVTAELSGFYASPSVWQGTFKSKAIWSMDAGLSKNVLKNKGTVKMSVADIFWTQKFKGEANFAGQKSIASGGMDSRQFRINFSYRFGSNQVKAARNRNSGLEDEKSRTQSSGGLGGGQN